MIKYLSSFVLVVLLAGCASTNKQDITKIKFAGVDCASLEENKYKFDCFYEKANNGDSLAQSWIGYYYSEGKYVKKDYNTSNKWHKKALSNEKYKDKSYSQREIALNYLAMKEKEKAFPWLEKAASSYDSIALRELAYMYDDGIVVKRDYEKAFELFKKAAYQGDKFAQNEVGYYYTKGWAVEKDYKKAKYWFEKAFKQKDHYAASQLGYLYAEGKGVKKDFEKAFYYFDYAYKKKPTHKYSLEWLGYLYESGKGVVKDLQKAKFFYEKANTSYAKKQLNRLIKKGLIK